MNIPIKCMSDGPYFIFHYIVCPYLMKYENCTCGFNMVVLI